MNSEEIEFSANDLKDKILRFFKEYIKKGEETIPTFFVNTIDENEEKHMDVISTPFSNLEEKIYVARILKKAFNERNVQSYLFACEGWSVIRDAKKHSIEDIKKELDITPPSQHADRQEVLTLLFVHRSGFRKGWAYRIFREGDNIVFTEVAGIDGAQVIDSRFVFF